MPFVWSFDRTIIDPEARRQGAVTVRPAHTSDGDCVECLSAKILCPFVVVSLTGDELVRVQTSGLRNVLLWDVTFADGGRIERCRHCPPVHALSFKRRPRRFSAAVHGKPVANLYQATTPVPGAISFDPPPQTQTPQWRQPEDGEVDDPPAIDPELANRLTTILGAAEEESRYHPTVAFGSIGGDGVQYFNVMLGCNTFFHQGKRFVVRVQLVCVDANDQVAFTLMATSPELNVVSKFKPTGGNGYRGGAGSVRRPHNMDEMGGEYEEQGYYDGMDMSHHSTPSPGLYQDPMQPNLADIINQSVERDIVRRGSPMPGSMRQQGMIPQRRGTPPVGMPPIDPYSPAYALSHGRQSGPGGSFVHHPPPSRAMYGQHSINTMVQPPMRPHSVNSFMQPPRPRSGDGHPSWVPKRPRSADNGGFGIPGYQPTRAELMDPAFVQHIQQYGVPPGHPAMQQMMHGGGMPGPYGEPRPLHHLQERLQANQNQVMGMQRTGSPAPPPGGNPQQRRLPSPGQLSGGLQQQQGPPLMRSPGSGLNMGGPGYDAPPTSTGWGPQHHSPEGGYGGGYGGNGGNGGNNHNGMSPYMGGATSAVSLLEQQAQQQEQHQAAAYQQQQAGMNPGLGAAGQMTDALVSPGTSTSSGLINSAGGLLGSSPRGNPNFFSPDVLGGNSPANPVKTEPAANRKRPRDEIPGTEAALRAGLSPFMGVNTWNGGELADNPFDETLRNNADASGVDPNAFNFSANLNGGAAPTDQASPHVGGGAGAGAGAGAAMGMGDGANEPVCYNSVMIGPNGQRGTRLMYVLALAVDFNNQERVRRLPVRACAMTHRHFADQDVLLAVEVFADAQSAEGKHMLVIHTLDASPGGTGSRGVLACQNDHTYEPCEVIEVHMHYTSPTQGQMHRVTFSRQMCQHCGVRWLEEPPAAEPMGVMDGGNNWAHQGVEA